MLLKAMAVAGALLALSGCAEASDDMPAGPSPATGPLSGTWTGTLTAPGLSQSVRVDLTEYVFGSAFTAVGTYTITSGSGRSAGSASGLTVGSQVTLTARRAPRRRSCRSATSSCSSPRRRTCWRATLCSWSVTGRYGARPV